MYHPLWSSMHIPNSPHTVLCGCLGGLLSFTVTSTQCCATRVNSVHALCSPPCIQCHESVLRASGYYKAASAAGPCTSCESNSGDIMGVSGCASCAAPSSNTGPVLCCLVGMVLASSPHVFVGMSVVTDRVTRIANPLLGASHGGRVPSRQ